MDTNELLNWKFKVFSIYYAEQKLKKLIELKRINNKEKKQIQAIIDTAWINIWHFHPDNNPSLEQGFKLNFC